MDRPDSTGLPQFTSGTLEVCCPPWPCCLSDVSALTGYATLMMMSALTGSKLRSILIYTAIW